MPVDLRSDTFTLPTPAMYRAIASAELGDDVWGEDPTVKQLEFTAAEVTGKDAALLVPTATMANLLGVVTQAHPGQEVILDTLCHTFLSESAGGAVVGGVQYRTIDYSAGYPTAEQVTAAIRAPDVHHPVSALLCLENTHNFRGGLAIPVDRIAAAAGAAHARGLRVHLDGARLFNASIALGVTPADLCAPVDTVSVALTKGLSAPVGAILTGDTETIASARRWRKRLGGGMRQAGVIAAAGLVALTEMPARLVEDHANAQGLGRGVGAIAGLRLDSPVETNIVMVRVPGDAADFARRCAAAGLLLAPFGEGRVRLVTHRGVSAGDVDHALEALAAAAGANQHP
jgi:threonine aldolase